MFSPQFSGIKTACFRLIIFQRVKLPTRNNTHLWWCNWRIFKGKTTRKVHQGGLVLEWKCPRSPGTCNPEETGLPGLPVTWSANLFSRSVLVRQASVPCTEKNNCKVDIFRPTKTLPPWTSGWADNFLNFLVTSKGYSNRLKSVLSFEGSMLNKSRVWSL